jgi:hypothetical protein
VHIGNGDSTLFWKDFWSKGGTLCDQFPRLFSYTLHEDSTVADLALSPNLSSQFALPLSVEAYGEFIQVQELLSAITIMPETLDARRFVWGNTVYTSAKFYEFLFSAVPVDLTLRAIWKSKSLPKLKVFVWLLFKDRLNTRDIILRRHWHLDSGPSCILCSDQTLETRDHLFFDCTFAKECWTICQITWDLSLPITDRFIASRATFAGPCFMEIFACASWNIWKERNNYIFNQRAPSLDRWKVRFQSDLMLHRFRVKPTLVQPLVDWVIHFFT